MASLAVNHIDITDIEVENNRNFFGFSAFFLLEWMNEKKTAFVFEERQLRKLAFQTFCVWFCKKGKKNILKKGVSKLGQRKSYWIILYTKKIRVFLMKNNGKRNKLSSNYGE